MQITVEVKLEQRRHEQCRPKAGQVGFYDTLGRDYTVLNRCPQD